MKLEHQDILIKSQHSTVTQSFPLWKAIYTVAVAEGIPFAMWRLPKSTEQHLILDFGGTLKPQAIDWDDNTLGFAMSPFVNPALSQNYRIRADVHLTSLQEVLDFFEHPSVPQDFKQKVNKLLKGQDKQPKNGKEAYLAPQKNIAENDFQDNVKKGIQAILEGELQKVVLSRPKHIELPSNFEAVSVFQKLSAKYFNAFVYLSHLPDVGTWMGASPEILLSIDQHQWFTTVALAGTQPYLEGQVLSEVAWRQKEIEEQALVSRYIINCFKKIRLREFKEEGPKTVVAGNLMHLKTIFQVDMQATNFPELGKVMLELLHPTSAVCGMPKQKALDFILEHEGYDRAFYSGFLGPINLSQEIHLFVNLRCMQIHEKQLTLYAGAGITEDSIPEKEWKETEMKCQTMLNIL